MISLVHAQPFWLNQLNKQQYRTNIAETCSPGTCAVMTGEDTLSKFFYVVYHKIHEENEAVPKVRNHFNQEIDKKNLKTLLSATGCALFVLHFRNI
ncbi:hypothetical protein [Acetobacter sp. DmW_125130]|uniref:hypothetical protein n=2 Tax=Acetobacteraceae TaxID=433 RepID=UPI001408154C|nr:hypothetical protein [Acetobacter sp. DmW_125130]